VSAESLVVGARLDCSECLAGSPRPEGGTMTCVAVCSVQLLRHLVQVSVQVVLSVICLTVGACVWDQRPGPPMFLGCGDAPQAVMRTTYHAVHPGPPALRKGHCCLRGPGLRCSLLEHWDCFQNGFQQSERKFSGKFQVNFTLQLNGKITDASQIYTFRSAK